MPAAKNLLLALIASPFINVSSALLFLHMTRHYEPEHEAAKHGGLQGVPIMTLLFKNHKEKIIQVKK